MSGANPGNPSGGIGFIDSVQAADEHTYQEEVVLDQAKDGKHAITHVEDGPEFSKEEYDLNQDIADAENVQRGMTIKEAIRNYYPVSCRESTPKPQLTKLFSPSCGAPSPVGRF